MTRRRIERALLSVSDKDGLVPFARSLSEMGVVLVSSGGTSKALADAGVPVTAVESVTGAPEMLDGRVKTLHPRIHGGILADRDKKSHRADLESQEIAPIDLVVVNLYPFVEKPGIETIDIGGPAMVRAAAKNHGSVAVVTRPDQYEGVIAEMRAHEATLGADTREELALEAFALTASYDAAIVGWLQREETLPRHLVIPLERADVLRYGENPHQEAARYTERNVPPGWPERIVQHGGKEMSYINYLDADASWSLVHEFDDTACVVVKHANPCGVALADEPAEAYRRAFACDDLSAFGGVVALNRELDVPTAEAIAGVFTEVVIAPSYAEGALEVLAARKNLRVLEAPVPGVSGLQVKALEAGMLVQQPDCVSTDRGEWTVATKASPSEGHWRDLVFAWQVCAATGSNAIVLAKDGQAFGIGAGQQSRVHSTEIAAKKAGGRAEGGVAASDAFFPFRDGIDAAAEAGVSAVIQPGGSMRDDEVVEAADEHGIAMVFTGARHFRH
ncbi:MAG: bifunctional phosphoribosylaminoimidazolecarboxamide formyltransferase/IMP cyclohydrolase [Acidimicrobiia bacterium]